MTRATEPTPSTEAGPQTDPEEPAMRALASALRLGVWGDKGKPSGDNLADAANMLERLTAAGWSLVRGSLDDGPAALDAAWAEAEAALPEWWRISTLMIDTDDTTWIAEAEAHPVDVTLPVGTVLADGPTPAAALLSLAAALAERLRSGS